MTASFEGASPRFGAGYGEGQRSGRGGGRSGRARSPLAFAALAVLLCSSLAACASAQQDGTAGNATDAAAATDDVTVIGTFPADTHPAIVYPVADIANRDFPAEGEFLDYLRGSEAKKIFEREGFLVVSE